MKKKFKHFIVTIGLIISIFFLVPFSEGFDLSGTWVFLEDRQPAGNSVKWIELIPDDHTGSIYTAIFNHMTKTEDEYGNQRTQDRRDSARGILRINGGIGILTLRNNKYSNREYRVELTVEPMQMRGTCRSFRNGKQRDSQPCFFERCDIEWVGRRWFCR